jgi:hypothetical protein
MFSLTDLLIIWVSCGIPIIAGAYHVTRKLDALAATLDRINKVDTCAKKACSKKTKGLLRGNDK